MPIYEFYSPTTSKIYSFYSRSISLAEKTPLCPDGKEHKMKKLLSGFSITSKDSKDDVDNDPSTVDEGNPMDDLDPQKAELLMRELEGATSQMDDENPDPKQMGQLMRKMCDLTGEKMDEKMEEVVRKLEEGVDPEVLEEQMGDFVDDSESVDSSSSEEKEKLKKKLKRAFRKKIERDPKLYELADYI